MLTTLPLWAAGAGLATAALGTWFDLRNRRIPNALTALAFALAITVHGLAGGVPGALAALAGALAAGGLLLPGWLLGSTGAGDVKLMAAIGAWLAWPAALVAVVATLIAGGVVALVTAIRNRSLLTLLRASWSLARSATSGGTRAATGTGIRVPYGVSILIGCAWTLCLRLR